MILDVDTGRISLPAKELKKLESAQRILHWAGVLEEHKTGGGERERDAAETCLELLEKLRTPEKLPETNMAE